jgi:hypothetical protein
MQPRDEDPESLLDREHQRSEPWSGTVLGRCDKCGGTGETEHRCESCRAGPTDPNCPACHGRVTYRGECPACEGTGEIDDTSRDGVSVFPDLDGLYRYMVRRDAHVEDAVVVELEGRPSEDDDFDADEGALLVHPTRIVSVAEPDPERLDQARRRSNQDRGS